MSKKFHKIIAFLTSFTVALAALPQLTLDSFAYSPIKVAEGQAELDALLAFPEDAIGSTFDIKEAASNNDIMLLADTPAFGTIKYKASGKNTTDYNDTTATSVISVDTSGNVTIKAVGTAYVLVWAEENDDYLESEVKVVTITVGKDTPIVTLNNGTSITKTYGDAAFTVPLKVTSTITANKDVTSDTTLGAQTWTSTDTTVATVSSTGGVTILKAGTTTIKCSLAASGNYNASAVKSVTLTVNKKAINLSSDVSVTGLTTPHMVGDAAQTITHTITGNGAATVSIVSESPATSGYHVMIAGTTNNTAHTTPISFGCAGTAKVQVSFAASTNYKAATWTSGLITVNQMSSVPTSVFSTSNATVTYDAANPTVDLAALVTKAADNANAPAPTGAVTFALDSAYTNPTGGSISGSTFTYTKAGVWHLKSTMAADSNYAAVSRQFTVTVNKAGQIITAPELSKNCGDAETTLVGHATLTKGNGALSYSVTSQSPTKLGGSVASISSNTLTILGAGTAVITVTAAETDQYSQATKTFTLTVNKMSASEIANDDDVFKPNSQTVTYDVEAATPQLTLTSTVAGRNGSPAPTGTITYGYDTSKVNPTGSSISGTTFSYTKKGTYYLTATLAADENYDGPVTKKFTVTVNGATPQLTITNFTVVYGDSDFNIASAITSVSDASTSPYTMGTVTPVNTTTDGTPHYALAGTSATDVITISSSGVVHILNTGMATINFSYDGSDKYNAIATQQITITVVKKTPTNDPNGGNSAATGISKVYLDSSFDVNDYFITDSDGVKTYESSAPSVLAIAADGTITVGIVGTATITVHLAETRNFAAMDIVINGEVTKATPTMSASTLNAVYLDTPIDLTNIDGLGTQYVTSNSPGAITYTVKAGSPAGVVSITDNVISFLKYGSVTVQATQAETENFSSKTIEFAVNVDRATPTLTATDIDKIFKDANFSLTDHAVTNSNGAVTYSILTETGRSNPSGTVIDDVVDLAGETVTIKHAGTATVQIAVAQTDQFKSATTTFKIVVAPKEPTASADDIDKTFLDPPFDLTGHLDTESDGAVSYTSGTPSILSITGTTATILHAGTVTVTATSTETQDYESKSTDFTVTIAKAQAAVTGTTNYDKLTTSADFSLEYTTSSDCPVTFSSSNTAVATVSTTGVVHITGAGTTTITISLAETNDYFGTSMDVTVTVIKDTPTLTGVNINRVFMDPAVDLKQHMQYNGDGNFTYSGYNEHIISISNHMMTINHAGTTSITVTAAETATWNSVSVTVPVNIAKAHPDIPNHPVVPPTPIPGSTPDPEPDPSDPNPPSPSDDHSKWLLDIDGDGVIEKTYEDPDFDIMFETDSDGAVTFASGTAAVATIHSTSGMVHILKAGTTVITAHIAETEDWYAADMPITLTINKCAVRFENTDPIEVECKTLDFRIPTTWNSDADYLITSDLLSVVEIQNKNILHIGVKGVANITIDVEENEKYLAGHVEIPVTVVLATPEFDLDIDGLDGDTITKRLGDPDFKLDFSCNTDAKPTFTIADENIATISDKGKIHLVAPGTTTFTISFAETMYYAAFDTTFNLKVLKQQVVVTGSDLNGINKNMGDPAFTPDITATPDVPVVITVDPAGILNIPATGTPIEIVGPGDCTLIYTYPETATTESLVVQIPVSVTGQQIGFMGADAEGVVMEVGETHQLVISPNFTGIDPIPNVTMTYTSKSTDIVEVDDKGLLSALAQGTGYITIVLGVPAPYVSSSITIPVTVIPKDLKYNQEQTIRVSYGDPDFSVYPVLYDRSFTPDFTFKTEDEKILSVDSKGTASIKGVGTTVVIAHLAATATYAEQDIITTVIVSKGDPKLKAEGMVLALDDEPTEIAYSCLSDGKVEMTTKNTNIISLVDNKVGPLAAGNASVTLRVAETEFYKSDTETISIIVNPDNHYNVQLNDFIATTTPRYRTLQGLRISVKDIDETKTVPFIVYREEDKNKIVLYQGTITSIMGETVATDFNVDLGNLTGTVRLFAQLSTNYDGFDSFPEDNIMELVLDIPTPNLSITLGDIADAYTPGQFVTLPYIISGWGFDFNTRLTVQACLDGEPFSVGYADISSVTGKISTQISGYLPASAVKGKHTVSVQIVPDADMKIEDRSALVDSKEITITTANLGLLVNNVLMKQVDTFMYSASTEICDFTFETVDPLESISILTLDGKTYTINKNKDSMTLALAKSESIEIGITVISANELESKLYSLTVTRGNDDTSVIVTVIGSDDKIYPAEIIDGIPTVDLPEEVDSGILNIKTSDANAVVHTIDGNIIDKNDVDYPFTMPATGEYRPDIVIMAEDPDVTADVLIILTNVNYTPLVAVSNANEIAGTVYGSKGVFRSEFIPYGNDVTNVENAITSGKTHGVIIDLEVSDRNYSQYLTGYATIAGVRHQVHWNSFDGPTIAKAKDIEHGFIYVDSTFFSRNYDNIAYSVVVEDYKDAAALDAISNTSVDINFSVNITAGDFTAYFSSEESAVLITVSGEGTLTYRKSLDNGVTWTEPAVTAERIEVVDHGTSLYEITLTDRMQNVTTKTVTAYKVDGDIALDGVNIFAANSRKADYIYINTKKSNASSVNAGILSIFGSDTAES